MSAVLEYLQSGALLAGMAVIVGSCFALVSKSVAASRAVLQEQRVKAFPLFWESVRQVCTPSQGCELTYEDLGCARDRLESRYHEHGVFLDASSRVLAIHLRERLARIVRDGDRDKPLKWMDGEWVRLWVVKTAFRISLERTLNTPRPLRAWRRKRKTFRVDLGGMKQQLLLKLTLVEKESGCSRTGSELEGLIQEALHDLDT